MTTTRKRKQTKGRKRGGHNRGYYWHKTKGCWCESSTQRRLYDANGEKLTDPKESRLNLEQALQRYRTGLEQSARTAAADAASGAGVAVQEICNAYLEHARRVDRPNTVAMRREALFDFCTGLPAGLAARYVAGTLSTQEIAAARIHNGYGTLTVGDCRFFHLTEWITAHPTWNGATRSKLQAVKRAFNWAVEEQRIGKNPFKLYKVPKSNERLTYITPEQETLILKIAKREIAQAIKFLIRTGCRPGEFCKLTAEHVSFDQAGRMKWTFKPYEVKNKILDRVVFISSAEIIEATKAAIKKHPKGPLWFGPLKGDKRQPLTVRKLSNYFTRIKKRLAKLRKPLDPDSCLYSCRHTSIKRQLSGYYTGKPQNIEAVARIHGNTVEVCRKYAQWVIAFQEPLWDCVAGM